VFCLAEKAKLRRTNSRTNCQQNKITVCPGCLQNNIFVVQQLRQQARRQFCHWNIIPEQDTIKKIFAATMYPSIHHMDTGWLGKISFITGNNNLFEYTWREGLSISIPINFATIKLLRNDDVIIKSSSVSKLPHTKMIWRINETALCGVKLE